MTVPDIQLRLVTHDCWRSPAKLCRAFSFSGPAADKRLTPANIDSGHGAGKTKSKGRGNAVEPAHYRSVVTGACGPTLRGFVCDRKRAACTAGSCIALSRFAGAVAARGLAGHECEGAGDRLRRATARRPTQAATHAAQGCRNLPPEVFSLAGAPAGMDRG